MPWVWSGAATLGAPVWCARVPGELTPTQAVYTIVLMPLGLALLLVGAVGAGGCPWWCAAWFAHPLAAGGRKRGPVRAGCSPVWPWWHWCACWKCCGGGGGWWWW